MLFFDCIKIPKVLSALPVDNSLKGKTVLFATIRNYSIVLHEELFMANIIANMGATVYYIMDDGNLPHLDTLQIHHNAKHLNLSNSIHNRLVEFLLTRAYSKKNIHKLKLSNYISEREINHELSLLDKCDEDNCISSVRRYFECGKFDKSNLEHLKYYDLCAKNCAIIKVGVRNIVSKFSPDIAIISHGIYSIWGSAYNVLKNEKNIPTYIYGAHAYGIDSTLFTDTICQTLSKDSDAIAFVENGSFSNEQYEKIVKYFSDRRLHATKDTSIYYSWIDKLQNNSNSLNNNKLSPGHVPTFCLFTNIVWDGDVAQKDTIFNGMLDSTVYTINKFRSLPYELYVRIHPAEASLWKDSIKMYDVIHKEIPDIEDIPNVHIIDSNQPVDSYKFVSENVDVALVYDGILSLELTALGCPVISPSTTRYSNGVYVINPKSIEEYDSYLEKPEKCMNFLNKDKIDAMYKFAYWFIYLAGYCYPIYDERYFGKLIFSDVTIRKINSPEFYRFIEKIRKSIL